MSKTQLPLVFLNTFVTFFFNNYWNKAIFEKFFKEISISKDNVILNVSCMHFRDGFVIEQINI